MTVLDDLWYGNIDPSEQFLIGNTHFKELVSVMTTNREKLFENFTAEQIRFDFSESLTVIFVSKCYI